jgi:hypothetical protein
MRTWLWSTKPVEHWSVWECAAVASYATALIVTATLGLVQFVSYLLS